MWNQYSMPSQRQQQRSGVGFHQPLHHEMYSDPYLRGFPVGQNYHSEQYHFHDRRHFHRFNSRGVHHEQRYQPRNQRQNHQQIHKNNHGENSGGIHGYNNRNLNSYFRHEMEEDVTFRQQQEKCPDYYDDPRIKNWHSGPNYFEHGSPQYLRKPEHTYRNNEQNINIEIDKHLNRIRYLDRPEYLKSDSVSPKSGKSELGGLMQGLPPSNKYNESLKHKHEGNKKRNEDIMSKLNEPATSKKKKNGAKMNFPISFVSGGVQKDLLNDKDKTNTDKTPSASAAASIQSSASPEHQSPESSKMESPESPDPSEASGDDEILNESDETGHNSFASLNLDSKSDAVEEYKKKDDKAESKISEMDTGVEEEEPVCLGFGFKLEEENKDEDEIPSTTKVLDENFGKWEQHTKGIGTRLLSKWGYKEGKGLGANLQGRAIPVEATGHGGQKREAVGFKKKQKVPSQTELIIAKNFEEELVKAKQRLDDLKAKKKAKDEEVQNKKTEELSEEDKHIRMFFNILCNYYPNGVYINVVHKLFLESFKPELEVELEEFKTTFVQNAIKLLPKSSVISRGNEIQLTHHGRWAVSEKYGEDPPFEKMKVDFYSNEAVLQFLMQLLQKSKRNELIRWRVLYVKIVKNCPVFPYDDIAFQCIILDNILKRFPQGTFVMNDEYAIRLSDMGLRLADHLYPLYEKLQVPNVLKAVSMDGLEAWESHLRSVLLQCHEIKSAEPLAEFCRLDPSGVSVSCLWDYYEEEHGPVQDSLVKELADIQSEAISRMPSRTSDSFWLFAPGNEPRGEPYRVGKWMLFLDNSLTDDVGLTELDQAWIEIKDLVNNGTLLCAKCSTAKKNPNGRRGSGVINCYTRDFQDGDDVKSAGLILRRETGYDKIIRYKTDQHSLDRIDKAFPGRGKHGECLYNLSPTGRLLIVDFHGYDGFLAWDDVKEDITWE